MRELRFNRNPIVKNVGASDVNAQPRLAVLPKSESPGTSH